MQSQRHFRRSATKATRALVIAPRFAWSGNDADTREMPHSSSIDSIGERVLIGSDNSTTRSTATVDHDRRSLERRVTPRTMRRVSKNLTLPSCSTRRGPSAPRAAAPRALHFRNHSSWSAPARRLCVRGRYDKNVDALSALRQSCRVRALRLPRHKWVRGRRQPTDALNGTNMLICRIGQTISSAVFAPSLKPLQRGT